MLKIGLCVTAFHLYFTDRLISNVYQGQSRRQIDLFDFPTLCFDAITSKRSLTCSLGSTFGRWQRRNMTMMIVISRSVFLFCAPSTIDLLKKNILLYIHPIITTYTQRWTIVWALGCEKFLPGPAWLLLSETGPPLSASMYIFSEMFSQTSWFRRMFVFWKIVGIS